MDFALIAQNATAVLTAVGLKVVGAFLIYLVGRWLINLAIDLVRKELNRQKFDPTLIRYASSFVAVATNIALVVAILGYFGVETTTFAALVAAIGIAIGAAWGGLLANFAAGVFLVILRPYKVGDFICAGGVTGTVHEVGLFVTTIDTPDNVQTYVGNNKVFSDNIQNFSTNHYRRVDLVAQLNNRVDHKEAIQLLKAKLVQIPNVLSSPAPDVEILEFNLNGPVLAVRPYCNNAHYWQVYFDTNRLIRESFSAADFPAPIQEILVRNAS